jgi:hypothetical protein
MRPISLSLAGDILDSIRFAMLLEDHADGDGAHSRLLQRYASIRSRALQRLVVVVLLPSLGTGRPVLDVNDERILGDH